MQTRGRSLRILMTNNTLATRAGSEVYVRDLAIDLMKRGHFPVAYSQSLGEVAEELAAATIPVQSDLREMSAVPDVIHGQHHIETMSASLHFPQVPVIYTCHGWLPWEEWPPYHPNIMRYVAVDDLCRERLLTVHGISAGDVTTIYNFVDLERFYRVRDLPKKPKSALVFSNVQSSVPEGIKAACAKIGIERIDIAGNSSGNPVSKPENILADYDIVFAKARAAIEAMASGCAVVVMDYAHLGGMVTMENVDRFRRLNFGIRALQTHILNEDNLVRQLELYDAADGRRVTEWIRSNASLASAVDQWVETYHDAIEGWEANSPSISNTSILKATSQYLRSVAPRIKMGESHLHARNILEAERTALISKIEAISAKAKKIHSMEMQLNELSHELNKANSELESTKSALSLSLGELSKRKSSRLRILKQRIHNLKNWIR
ncbi:glycosyltransferase [Roseibium aggregatum]|nr:glycosyltransferase [Roseibium aggregatum]